MATERSFLIGFCLFALIFIASVGNEYLLHIAVLICFYAMLATSLNLVLGYVGEFPLGHAAFFGIGAYTIALLTTGLDVPVTAAVLLGGVMAAGFGLVIGGLTLRLKGPYFVIITLAFAEVLRLVANNWIGFTNGPMGISGLPAPALIAELSWLPAKKGYGLLGLALLAIVLFFAYRLVNSNIGKAAVTIRENRYVAMSIGINPFRCALFVFIAAAAMAGVAGGFYGTYVSHVGPEVFGFPFIVSMVIMVLLGGKGTLTGPVVGAVLVTLLEEYLRELQGLRLSIFGIVVMAVVLYFPSGIVGYLRSRHGSKKRHNANVEARHA